MAANPQAIAKIPAGFHFVHPGYLTVATSANNSPPIGLWASDNKTLIGSDPDIARLLADSLGLKLRLVPAAWEDWPLGITAGRYDVAMFNIAVTEERKQKFDFATYRADNHAFAVKADSKISAIRRREDVAGKRIIVGSGTNQERILLSWDEKNRAQGLAPVQPIYLNDDASATLALLSGRADASFGPQAMAAWKVASRGQTKLSDTDRFAPGWRSPRRRAMAWTSRCSRRSTALLLAASTARCWQDGVKRARRWRFRRLIRRASFIRRIRAGWSGARGVVTINGDPIVRTGFSEGAHSCAPAKKLNARPIYPAFLIHCNASAAGSGRAKW